MSRRAAVITQAEVNRMIRAAQGAGLKVRRIVATKDGVSIDTVDKDEVSTNDAGLALDGWLEGQKGHARAS